jgi:hypothetical protein
MVCLRPTPRFGCIANGAEVKLLGSWSDIVRSWKASL